MPREGDIIFLSGVASGKLPKLWYITPPTQSILVKIGESKIDIKVGGGLAGENRDSAGVLKDNKEQ